MRPMSTTIDIFIKHEGSKKQLLKILADDFLILANKKKYWFLNFINLGLYHRRDDPDYFVGHQFRPYNFVLSGTTYMWSSSRGTARDAHSIIMDTLAQTLAIKLRSRTMSYFGDSQDQRRYRHVRPMKRNAFAVLLDEKTGRPPAGFFNP
jgi:hypothetical protein